MSHDSPAPLVSEVKVVVNKILTYESTGPAAKPWYKTFIGIGGKTFAITEGKPDGEYLCDLAYNYTKNAIPDLQLVRCYSHTNRDHWWSDSNIKGYHEIHYTRRWFC